MRFMIPARFVELETFPYTSSGKVDRSALRAADATRPRIVKSHCRARNALEEALTKLWVEVLEVDDVGVTESFFDVGGDSVKATRLLARVSRDMGVEFPPEVFFSAASIAEMAVLLRGVRQNEETAANGKPVSENRGA